MDCELTKLASQGLVWLGNFRCFVFECCTIHLEMLSPYHGMLLPHPGLLSDARCRYAALNGQWAVIALSVRALRSSMLLCAM